MVGVPGKYKGCNTCRRRRVRCGMERPACKKCEDSGRECAGYERDLTFIVGTPAEKGRCSSHPHRSTLKANQEKKAAITPPRRRVTPTNVTSVPEPWTTPSPSKSSELQTSSSCIFVHTPSLHFYPRYENDSDVFTIPDLGTSLPFLGSTNADHQLSIRGFAFVEDISEPSDDGDGHRRQRRRTQLRSSPTSAPRQSKNSEEPKKLYIFQATTEPLEEETTFAHIVGGTPDQVKAQGPSAFQDSPAHQFFARLWRPLAITTALQHERKSFVEQPHWVYGPFEKVSKTNFDLLWDIIVKLPGICERARRTVNTADKANINYRLRSAKARDLLGACANIQKDLDGWLEDVKGTEEGNNIGPIYLSLQPSPQSRGSQRRSSPSSQLSPFPRYDFRDPETAQLIISYWSALVIFYKMVAEVLIVAEPPQDSGTTSLVYRPSAATSPAYNNSSPQASVSSTSVTSPPISINASEHSGYGIATTEGYGYYSTPADTSFNPQYPTSISVAPQQQTPYMNFSTDTYPTTTGYAPVTTYAPDTSFMPDTAYSSIFENTMNMFPAQPTDFDFNNLEYINVDTSYLPGLGSNGASGMDYLPPPQRNSTPASYILAPGSHHSPANSWVSAASSAAGSHNPSHAPTPPDHNDVANNQAGNPAAGDGGLFNTPGGPFASLYQNSRASNLTHLSSRIGSGLDFLLNNHRVMHVVLLVWPLEVLESTCSSHERTWCADLRRKLDAAAESSGRLVRGKRWRAIGEAETEED